MHPETGDVLTPAAIDALILAHGAQVVNELDACYWVESDLCSACLGVQAPTAAEAPPLLYGPDGRPLRGAP